MTPEVEPNWARPPCWLDSRGRAQLGSPSLLARLQRSSPIGLDLPVGSTPEVEHFLQFTYFRGASAFWHFAVCLLSRRVSIFAVYLVLWRVSILAFCSLLTFMARKHFYSVLTFVARKHFGILQFTYFRGA